VLVRDILLDIKMPTLPQRPLSTINYSVEKIERGTF